MEIFIKNTGTSYRFSKQFSIKKNVTIQSRKFPYEDTSKMFKIFTCYQHINPSKSRKKNCKGTFS